MKVQMKVEMSGTRNGVEWPGVGGEVTLPDGEGAKLCAAGLAIPIADRDADIEQRETDEYVGPDSSRANKGDADKSARAADKRAALVEKPKASRKSK